MSHSIAMLGAGSWGTAIAIHLAKKGNRVMLWGHQAQHVLAMQTHRENQRYLPGIPFPPSIEPVSDMVDCLSQATLVIIAVPSHAFASVLATIKQPLTGLAWLTKGLDPATHYLLSDLVSQAFGRDFPIAVISGPSFAKEVAHALPTALTLACNHQEFQQSIQTLLHHHNLRIYLSQDIVGVQLCGAIKNVLAIACGISDGLGYGANAKAALITRGLAEMIRLGKCLGACDESFTGLAGLGDLVLTCTDNQSRNRRFGLQLGQGISMLDAETTIGQVVEGKYNAHQVCMLAKRCQIEMPICTQVHALLTNQVTALQAVHNLMTRSIREE
jgi:glycerol-3-phosphate dehydrogenase (NAD(P)+)